MAIFVEKAAASFGPCPISITLTEMTRPLPLLSRSASWSKAMQDEQIDITAINGVTTVADVGARYGIHPSWNGYDAPLRYIAFEPDPEEAGRLRGVYESTPFFTYEVLETALDKQSGRRDFPHLLKHRGLSSCLKPDLKSECFRHLKPGQATIEKIIKVETERGDDAFARLEVVPDFLKIDTEGTEQDVIEGCEQLLSNGVLGIRSSCNFQPCYIGQRLFSHSHDYLWPASSFC